MGNLRVVAFVAYDFTVTSTVPHCPSRGLTQCRTAVRYAAAKYLPEVRPVSVVIGAAEIAFTLLAVLVPNRLPPPTFNATICREMNWSERKNTCFNSSYIQAALQCSGPVV